MFVFFLYVCVCVRYTWCLNCGRQVSVWIMVSSETTTILEMPTSSRQSEGGEDVHHRSMRTHYVLNVYTVNMCTCVSLISVIHLFDYETLLSAWKVHIRSCWLSPCREIPLELRQRSRGGQVNLDMEDHRDEDFTKPKLAFKAFEGEGQKLGRWAWWAVLLLLNLTWFLYLFSSAKYYRWKSSSWIQCKV